MLPGFAAIFSKNIVAEIAASQGLQPILRITEGIIPVADNRKNVLRHTPLFRSFCLYIPMEDGIGRLTT